jgi:MFS family permease
MGYFTESITTEKRGRASGITLLLTGVGMVAFGIIGGSIEVRTIILSAWKIMGLLFLLIFKETKTEVVVNPSKIFSYFNVIKQRTFVLYLVPWIMFSLITYLTAPVQNALLDHEFIDLMIIIENVFIAIFAVVGGFLLDIVGRKRMSIIGFALIGIGYAALGIDITNMANWYFYTVVDGVAWGILLVIFVITVWGDISYGAPSDKFYAIGVLPFFISKFLQFTIGDQIAASVPATSIFSLTAFFLFIAVLPLVYAPETLPEKTMRDRELKSYLYKAQKLVQKETEKNKKMPQESRKVETNENVVAKNDEEDEKAKKLAEKFYKQG